MNTEVVERRGKKRTKKDYGNIKKKLYLCTRKSKTYTIMKIPGLSFSLKRAVGITKVKQSISRATGIPMTKQGLERKVGGSIIKKLTGK